MASCNWDLRERLRFVLSASRGAHQLNDIGGGGETKGSDDGEWGLILLICLDVTDLATIGTLAGCSSWDFIAIDTG